MHKKDSLAELLDSLYTIEEVVDMIMTHESLRIRLCSILANRPHYLPVDATEVVKLIKAGI